MTTAYDHTLSTQLLRDYPKAENGLSNEKFLFDARIYLHLLTDQLEAAGRAVVRITNSFDASHHRVLQLERATGEAREHDRSRVAELDAQTSELDALHAEVEKLRRAQPNWSHAEALTQRDVLIQGSVQNQATIRELRAEIARMRAAEGRLLEWHADLLQLDHPAPMAAAELAWRLDPNVASEGPPTTEQLRERLRA